MSAPPFDQSQPQPQPQLEDQQRELDFWASEHQRRTQDRDQQGGIGGGGYTPSQPSFDANETASGGRVSEIYHHQTSAESARDWRSPDYSGYPSYSAHYNPPFPSSYDPLSPAAASSSTTARPADQSHEYSPTTTAANSASNWYQPPVSLQHPSTSVSATQAYFPYSPTHPQTHTHIPSTATSLTTSPSAEASYSGYPDTRHFPYSSGYSGPQQLQQHPAFPASSSAYSHNPQYAASVYASTSCNTAAAARYQPVPSARRGGQTRLDSYATDLAHYESPKCSWAEFLVEWANLIASDPAPIMQRSTNPTFAEVEDLCNGLASSGYRVTVEKLKTIIRGINSLSSSAHLKLSGTKAQLMASISAYLRLLASRQSPEYVSIAKLVGEAQGFQYPPTPGASTAGTSAAASNTASTSAAAAATHHAAAARQPYPPYQNGYGSAATAATNGYSHASTSANGAAAGPSSYASRSQDFGLSRSPVASYQRSPSTSTATAHNHYTATNGRLAPPSTNGVNSPYHSPYAGSSSTGANANVPTSWPARLPPRPAGLAGQPAIPMNFKPSPFYKIITAVSGVQTLYLAKPGDRATVQAPLYITDEQRQKLNEARRSPSAPQFQLRLFCTSSDNHQPNNTYGYTQRQPIPIEFPAACEAKVNDCPIPGSLKGIKKKPGTAAPANVTGAKFPSGHARAGSFALRLDSANDSNTVALHYANTEKSHYMVVYLVEYTPVDMVAERIRTNKVRTKEEVIKSLQRQADDPDIQATSQTISFKDPLAYVPLTIPIRGLHCQHIQCFDAKIFLEMMESTPTWLCPSCNRAINPDDLVLDGYTRDLMDQVPGSVESVIVETDGTWRSEDNKFGNSTKAIEARAAKAAAAENRTNGRAASVAISVGTGLSSKAGTPLDVKPDVHNLQNGNEGGAARRHGKGRGPSEIIDLDEEEDDKTPPPPRFAAAASQPAYRSAAAPANGRGRGAGVIDLTLSDDDDDDASSLVAIVRRPNSSNTSAANKRRVDSDWEDGPDQPSNQRVRLDY